MQYLSKCSLAILLISFFMCTGCRDTEKRQIQQSKLDYDQAVEMAKCHLLETKFYDQKEDVRFIYEPDNAYWHRYSSRSPEMLKAYGLAQRDYHAIQFFTGPLGTRDGGATVFVDKDGDCIIGVLYDNDFVKYSE